MRNLLFLFLSMILAAGCSDRAGANIHTDTSGTGVNTVLQEQISQTEADSAPSEPPAESGSARPQTTEGSADSADYETVDVDLTVLSATMVYSEVYNMLTQPDSYLGRSVRMHGQYTEHHNEMTGKTYYACIILDATACCAQGMEFILTENYVYPQDYPKEGDMVTVAGIYDRYEEDGFPYYTLRDAVLAES
ncbi:MAG: hypothetical protein IKS32_09870 [Solobacterium sp.]|nr:hypothetical protein [Solobacterium sp.]